MNREKLWLVFGLFICLNYASGQKYPGRNQLCADIDSLYASISEIHPDMFAVMPKTDFEKKIAGIKAILQDSTSVINFYQYLAPLVAGLGDGHTSMSFPRQELKNAGILLFPFSVSVKAGDYSVYVENDYTGSENRIPPGARIISINNRPCEKIVKAMIPFASGEIIIFRIQRINIEFTPLLYALYRDTSFNIVYSYHDSLFQAGVKGVSYAQRYEHRNQAQPEVIRSYSLSLNQDKGIAAIEFNSFDGIERFAVFIDSAFTVIKKNHIHDLIIDIRKNGGGNSRIGDEFFQYISPVPFRQFGKTTVKISDRVRQYNKTYNNWDMTEPNGIQTTDNAGLVKLRKNKLRFTGNVWLLTSNYSFSSAADFAWTFRYFKMGTIVGEETGGVAVCFGDIIDQTLPNSGINYTVSYKKFYNYGATDTDNHGTIPDYIVPAEKAMEAALELIENNKK